MNLATKKEVASVIKDGVNPQKIVKKFSSSQGKIYRTASHNDYLLNIDDP